MIIITYEHINGAGKLFGGRLAEWIDDLGGVTARRFCKTDATTACLDIDFLESAEVNDVVTLIGRVIYTGNTSLIVRVDAYKEKIGTEKTFFARGYLTFVALDKDRNIIKVPKIEINSDEEKAAFEEGQRRAQIKKELRNAK